MHKIVTLNKKKIFAINATYVYLVFTYMSYDFNGEISNRIDNKLLHIYILI